MSTNRKNRKVKVRFTIDLEITTDTGNGNEVLVEEINQNLPSCDLLSKTGVITSGKVVGYSTMVSVNTKKRADVEWDENHPEGAKELKLAYDKLLEEDWTSGEFSKKWEKIATAIVAKHENK